MIFDTDEIRIHREFLGLTQDDLATKMHCTKQFVAKVEDGFHKPNVRTIERIFEALGVTDPRPFFKPKEGK